MNKLKRPYFTKRVDKYPYSVYKTVSHARTVHSIMRQSTNLQHLFELIVMRVDRLESECLASILPYQFEFQKNNLHLNMPLICVRRYIV